MWRMNGTSGTVLALRTVMENMRSKKFHSNSLVRNYFAKMLTGRWFTEMRSEVLFCTSDVPVSKARPSVSTQKFPQIFDQKRGGEKYWTRAAQTFCRHTSIYRYYHDSHTAQDTSTPFLLGQPFILPKDNLVVAAVKATQKYFQRHLPGFGNTLHIKQLSLSSTIMSAQF